jgi:hypothetical protein
MSLDLHRELDDMARRAQQYADPHAVLRVVHERRRRHRLASAAAAVAVLALVGTVALQRSTLTPPRPPTTAQSAPSIVEPPATVDPPVGAVAALPADHAIGRAALAYQPSAGGPIYLVRPDGTQYTVPYVALADDNFVPEYRQFPLALSPDGRWLVVVGDRATHIRDLTGTVVRTLPGLALPESWSPDGRWLVYAEQDGRALLDLQSGRSWPIRGLGNDFQIVPTVDGQTLSTPSDGGDHALELERFDPTRGGPGHLFTVDASAVLGPDESLAWQFTVGPTAGGGCSGVTSWMSQVSADRLLLGVYDRPHITSCVATPPAADPIAYALVSAETGQVLGRLSLPKGAGQPLWFGEELMYPVQSSPTARVRIEAVDATGHNPRALTSLPATASFVLDGAAGPVAGPARR